MDKPAVVIPVVFAYDDFPITLIFSTFINWNSLKKTCPFFLFFNVVNYLYQCGRIGVYFILSYKSDTSLIWLLSLFQLWPLGIGPWVPLTHPILT